MFLILAVIFISFAIFFVCCKFVKFGICRCSQHLIGKVAIVTGSNIGIGFENAKDFAERGAKVILACRNEKRGTKARDDIIAATGNNDVHFYKLDLSSFKSIKEFVENFRRNEKRLDILVNNAGDFDLPITKTEDGLLLGMQVNYFGPFLLTNLLLPILKDSAPSRIVNVASNAYKIGKIDLENLNHGSDGVKGLFKVYGTAKLCTVLMTVELGRQLKGSGVTVNALCPGFVASNIFSTVRSTFWKYFVIIIAHLVAKDCWEGAQTQIYLSVSPEVKDVNGCYFTECKKRNLEDFVNDPQVAKKLWDITEKLTKIEKNNER